MRLITGLWFLSQPISVSKRDNPTYNHLVPLIAAILMFVMPFAAEALCVKKSKANLRRGPATTFPVSWVAGQYMPLKKIGSKGAWYRVKDVDGSIHWVHQSVVSESSRCVVVRVNKTNLRSGPGTRYKPANLATADRYTPFKSLGGEDGWVWVEDRRGGRAWVSLKNVWRPKSYTRLEF